MLKTLPRPKIHPEVPLDFAALPRGVERVYAIAFDMDTDTLQRSYPGTSWTNAYSEIKKVLDRHGFTRQQGSVYFGGASVNAVTCVLAAFDLAKTLPWFAISVRDIRMLRIEEMNDLLPAVLQAAGLQNE